MEARWVTRGKGVATGRLVVRTAQSATAGSEMGVEAGRDGHVAYAIGAVPDLESGAGEDLQRRGVRVADL